MLPKMNNKISINLFLNNHCKDALDFNEFIDKIQLSLEDLILTKELGYSKGISKIFLDRLKQLEKCERPIHCTDIKRNQFYIKEKQKWNLDNGDSVCKAIDNITTKQLIQINNWEKNNIGWKEKDNKIEEFMKITNNVTGGYTTKEKDKNIKDTLKIISINTSIKKAIN